MAVTERGTILRHLRGKIFPYHYTAILYGHCIYHHRIDYCCRASILCDDANARWRLYWVRRSARLDIEFVAETPGEGMLSAIIILYIS